MIFGSFERMVAFRYLRARRQEGFISVIAIFSLTGIALGVATLIIVMAVMNGFRGELLGRILGFNGDINVYAAEGSLGDYEAVAGKVAKLPGILAARPTIEGQVMATTPAAATGALVRGLSEHDLATQKLLASHVDPKTLAAFKDDTVLVGSRLAFRLGLKPGDPITFISPNGSATAFGTVPRIKTYTVAGTFTVGMYEYDNGVVFMPLAAAQTFFNLPNAVSSLELSVADPDAVHSYDREIMSGPRTSCPRLRLAAEQSQLLQRRRGRAQRHVPHPHPHHHRGGLQHRLQHDHAGEGQGARHRHPAHDGGDARHDPAHLHAGRRERRRSSARSWASSWAWSLPRISKRSARSCRASSAPISSPPRSIS